MKYILSIDQSTQGTKVVIFNELGQIVGQSYKAHQQIVDDNAYISHDAEEIYHNVILGVSEALSVSNIDRNNVIAAGLTNQRETCLIWDKNGKPLNYAVVWQCTRANEVCGKVSKSVSPSTIEKVTGLQLSPYYSAAKLNWLIENTPGSRELMDRDSLRLGTMDTFLVYKLSSGKRYVTEPSNASRTQLLNLETVAWDEQMCNAFNIKLSSLPEIIDSNSVFCTTSFEGLFDHEIPIHAVLGDSQASLYAHQCTSPNKIKATYGTGSSVAISSGNKLYRCPTKLSTSIGWSIEGQTNYILEGNITNTGSVISWLINDLGLIDSTIEANLLPLLAHKDDMTVLVPAFSGLGAPYFDTSVKAAFLGMTRLTGKAELVKAAVESIAFQVNDVIEVIKSTIQSPIDTLCVDGAPTANDYLMSFQSYISNMSISKPAIKEYSILGVTKLIADTLSLYQFQSCVSSDSQLAKINFIHDREELISRWNKACLAVMNF